MADLGGFDARNVEPNADFTPIPAGEYDAVIVASEMKKTSSGNGSYLQLEMQVLNGEQQNRKIWDRLNLQNPNEKAVQIARGTLSAICRAVGVLMPKDSSELHNKPLRIKVAIEKDDSGQYQDKNIVKAYKPRAGTLPPNANPPQGTPAGKPW